MRAARTDPWRMTKLPVDPEERRVARKRGRAARRRTHSCATTTPRVRRAIQASKEKNNVLAKRYGVSRKTIAKWKGRESTSDERMGPKNPSSNSDERMGPKNPSSNILTDDDEAIVLAYRWRTRLSLNDSHERLRRLMPKLSRSALYRCLKRRGLSRIGPTTASPALTPSALRGPYTFEITAHEVVFYHDGIGIVREARRTFMQRSRQLRLKTRRSFSPAWSLNFPKGSMRLRLIFTRHSPARERDSTKTWRLVLIPSLSPAAPAGSPTFDLTGLL